MNESSTCKKILSLLSLYIDKKLDLDDMQFVKTHLEICPSCYNKYIMLQDLVNEMRSAYQDFLSESLLQEKNQKFNIKEYEHFQTNISAYFDNELTLNDSVSMKKYMIKFPNARKEVELLYNLHNMIIDSKKEVKKSFTDDYSKLICEKILGKPINFKKNIALKVAIFVCIFFIGGFLLLISPVKTVFVEQGGKLLKQFINVQKTINHELAIDLMQ